MPFWPVLLRWQANHKEVFTCTTSAREVQLAQPHPVFQQAAKKSSIGMPCPSWLQSAAAWGGKRGTEALTRAANNA